MRFRFRTTENPEEGIFWFLGSAAIGLLYDRSIPAAVAFCVATGVLSLPFFNRGAEGDGKRVG